jgi:hypothetical protein
MVYSRMKLGMHLIILIKNVKHMTNFIPIFPLALVVYPGEELNLHIFEPRYKQLIKECFEQKKNFGIPSVLNEKMADLGTLVEIGEIVTTGRKWRDGYPHQGTESFSCSGNDS